VLVAATSDESLLAGFPQVLGVAGLLFTGYLVGIGYTRWVRARDDHRSAKLRMTELRETERERWWAMVGLWGFVVVVAVVVFLLLRATGAGG
jgi:hypothetical protein